MYRDVQFVSRHFNWPKEYDSPDRCQAVNSFSEGSSYIFSCFNSTVSTNGVDDMPTCASLKLHHLYLYNSPKLFQASAEFYLKNSRACSLHTDFKDMLSSSQYLLPEWFENLFNFFCFILHE